MYLKILLITFILGILKVLTCTQAIPIQPIYTGDSCDCPKKLNYFVNVPQPPLSETYEPSEYGYKLECPMPAKAKVTYSFDFAVEEPKTSPPPAPEAKLDLYAKIDRITSHKKDCITTEGEPRRYGCHQYDIDDRYVSPRYTRNLRQPSSVENMAPLSSHIIAIFLKPLKETGPGPATSKSRNKRDLTRIFMRPRKNEKRSDRLVKQYNKRLNDSTNENTFFEDTQKPTRYRTRAATPSSGMGPLQQFSSFLNLPALQNKRDIKGEYDLIEKEREQMDLTLPEIIQYMPETLDPNFKRNQCNFGQSCQHNGLSESFTKIATMTTTEKTDTAQNALSFTNANTRNGSIKDKEDQKEKIANSTSLTHTKRNIGDYGGRCPLVLKCQNPTPIPGFTYEPLTSFEAIPRPFTSANNPDIHDPVPQQYVGAPKSPYTAAVFDNNLVQAAPEKSSIQTISNSQLDRIIAAIVRKHSDFTRASSHYNGALVDPLKVQKNQANYFLKSLMAAPWNDWFSEYLSSQTT